jgi:hypothetical protein
MVSDLPGEPPSVTLTLNVTLVPSSKWPQAAELSRVGRDRETANSGFRYADTHRGIAKCKMTESPAVFGLSDAKPERDFISVVGESAAALETIPHSR